MVYNGAIWLASAPRQQLKLSEVRAVIWDSLCVAYGGRYPKSVEDKSNMRSLTRGTTKACSVMRLIMVRVIRFGSWFEPDRRIKGATQGCCCVTCLTLIRMNHQTPLT